MHDIDRTQLEFETDLDEFETSLFATPSTYSSETGVFSEADEMELAAELLASSDEQELDQFIGKLIANAGQAGGQPARGKTGSKLGGFLKGLAKNVLPGVARIAGTVVGGPAGGALAGKLASSAGKAFGLELEGLSPEDQEYETARRFVRFAGEASRQAGRQAGRLGPLADDPRNAQQAARQALLKAARKHAPGLLRRAATARDAFAEGDANAIEPAADVDADADSEFELPSRRGGAGRPAGGARGANAGASGRWVRQGGQIVLLGL